MVSVTAGVVVAAWDALPPEVQKAVAASAGKIVASGAASGFGRLVRRLLPTAEEKAKRTAIRNAISIVLANHSSLQEVGLAQALGRTPFASVILGVVERPTEKIDVDAVKDAFAGSIFDLQGIGIDENQLIQEIQSAVLEALRLGSSSTSRELHAGARLEQTAAGVESLHRKMDAIATATPHGHADNGVETLMLEAKALFDRGATKGALAIWERLQPRVLTESFSPTIRSRVLQNIAIVKLNEGDHVKALQLIEQALEYTPESTSLLARKVDAFIIADRMPAARLLASEIMLSLPESADAWVAHVRTAAQPVRMDELPTGLQSDPVVLFAVGIAASQANDSEHSIEALRAAVKHGPRVPAAILALAASLLQSLFPRRSGDAVPERVLNEVERLCEEITTELTTSDHATLRARAAYLLGEVSTLRGNVDGGSRFFQRAMELDTADISARLAQVRALVANGNSEVAKYLLDAIPDNERGPEWNAYRGAAALMAESTADISAYVQAVVSATEDNRQVQGASVLVEALLAEQEPSVAAHVEALLGVLTSEVPEDVVYTYQARLALVLGDVDRALTAYRTALAASEGPVRDELALELASCLFRAKDFEGAAELFASSSLLAQHTVVQKQYAESLLRLKRWHDLDLVLEGQMQLIPVPTWALGCDVQTALIRNDLPRAARSLRQLAQQRPEDPGVAIQLADVLLRLEEHEAALAAVESVRKRIDLDTPNMVNLALVLLRTGEFVDAVSIAFRAIRLAADDEEVQQRCLFGVVLAAETAGFDLGPLYFHERIGPDTVVKLRDRHGREHSLIVLAEGPTDVTKHEFLASDARVEALLGKAIGDRVVSLDTMTAGDTYEVMSVGSAIQFTVQNALQEFERRFPNQTSVRSIFVGEGTQFNADELVAMLQQREQRIERVKELYRQQTPPIALLSDSFGRSLRRTYLDLLADATIRVEVDQPPFTTAGESAVRVGTAVLTITGLATLKELGLVPLLTSQFERLIAPRSLVDELAAELAEWDAVVARGEYTTARAHGEQIATETTTAEEIKRVRNSIAALHLFVTTHAEILPRPETQSSDADELRKVLGDSSFDSVMLSGADAPLYADDLRLRGVALENRGEAGFATITILLNARERGLIDDAALHTAISRLREWRHSIVPVGAQELLDELMRSGLQISAGVRRMLDDAFHPALDVRVRIATATTLIREVAMASGLDVTLHAVSTAIAERLTASGDAHAIMLAFQQAMHDTLRLLPVAHKVVLEAVANVLLARNIPVVPRSLPPLHGP